MTAVTLNNLTKRYEAGAEDAPAAVNNLSLDIASGELVGFLGPSGCGKTTTLKMIAGLLFPTEGDITFDGVSVLGLRAEHRGAVMVFQNHLLFPYMSVADNVGFGLRMQNVPKSEIRDRVERMLTMVHLEGFGSRRPSELSGGQQQRVALARALVTAPRLLLLDEPLSNLDAHLRYEMRELILQLQRKTKVTTIFVTHDQQEAVILADRIALIFDGILQQYGRPRDFYESPSSERIASFFGAENFLKGVKSGTEVQTQIGKLSINSNSVPDGNIVLSIRPDSCEVCDTSGVNILAATVERCLYTGTAMRIWADINGFKLQLLCPARSQYQPGDRVRISLPPDRLMAIPAKAG